MSARLTQQSPTLVPVPALEIFAIAAEYVKAGRLDAADRLVGHILAVAPGHAEALHLRGTIAFRKGRLLDAADTMEKAMRLGAAGPLHYRNISEVYRQLGRLDEGAAAATRAVALEPSEPFGHFNLAMVEYDRLRIDASIAAARAAILRNPKMPEAHMKLGQALLVSGDLAAGWEHYEWRYQIPGAAPLVPVSDRKQWDGTHLGSNRLLLIADQGYGDVIMFGRSIAWARERCPVLTIACSPEMRPIIEQLAPGADIVVRWEDCAEYFAYLPLSGLPRVAGIRLEHLPGSVRYLKTNPALAQRWKTRIDTALPGKAMRIAVCWAGRLTHNNDRNRSIPLDVLAPLARMSNVSFVSLQKGPAAAQCASWPGPAPLLNLDTEIESFEDSAAILEAVDVLVSVDTSLVHLAGALGRPAFVMLPFAPDWRWLLEREDSPWYPSLRLFRQACHGDWAGVVTRIETALEAARAPNR